MELKPLEYYFGSRDELLSILLQVTEPERLLLSTHEFLQMLRPDEWKKIGFASPFSRTALIIPTSFTRIYYDEFPSLQRHYTYIPNYCDFMKHLYLLVQTRL